MKTSLKRVIFALFDERSGFVTIAQRLLKLLRSHLDDARTNQKCCFKFWIITAQETACTGKSDARLVVCAFTPVTKAKLAARFRDSLCFFKFLEKLDALRNQVLGLFLTAFDLIGCAQPSC